MTDTTKYDKLQNIIDSRILVLDGAFGTMIQQLNLRELDFRGAEFPDWPVPLKGCNDILALSNPQIVLDIHRRYIDAGADIIKTSSFNSNAISLADYQLGDLAYKIAYTSARIAREAADTNGDGREIFVAGSVGPTNRTSSISADISDPGKREVTFSQLTEAYTEQISGLLDGGADIILLETVFDTLNAKAALFAIEKLSYERGVKIPVMISVTFSDSSGRTLSGQTIEAFYSSISHFDLLSVGMNCAFGATKLYPWLKTLSGISRFPISLHPNAGLPNVLGQYDQTPETFAKEMARFMEEGLVNIVGGCCGTTPDFIRALKVETTKHMPRSPHKNDHILRLSNIEELTITKTSNFINIGERTNVAGSAKFARLIREGNYAEALSVARTQVEAGAQIIDVCMDDALIDGPVAISTFLNLAASEPAIARVPWMIDSSRWDTVEAALRVSQGKSIVNSISLKDGEKSFLEKARLIHQYGAAVVVMLFDEVGQATTFQRKVDIAKRSYNLLVGNGFPAEDIIFDPNILTIGTGIPEHDEYGKAFIDATRWIKENLPFAKVSGGVSNLSFAFRGNNTVRRALHTVFLYHAIAAGMDMAIVNPQMLNVYTDIDPTLAELAEDLILCRRQDASERLLEYAAAHTDSKETPTNEAAKGKAEISVEQRIEKAILSGNSDTIVDDVTTAAARYTDPLLVVDKILMPAMDTVGTLFGEGRMFLPQVIKSARVIKTAFNTLTPLFTENKLENKTGSVIIATVKGDVHDIGKNIVSVVVGCNGFEVLDLGVMADADVIVSEAEKLNPVAVMLSGLISPSLNEMIDVCQRLQLKGLDIPVIVGGAATSALHTAVKIAPAYEGIVIHSSDASHNTRILGSLTSVNRDQFLADVRSEQQRLRDQYEKSHNQHSLSKIEEARHKAVPIPNDLKNQSSHEGIKLFNPTIEEVEPYINWNYFFNSWGLPGKYPEVFDNEKYGDEARNLFSEANQTLEQLKKDKSIKLEGVVGTFPVCRKGDDLFVKAHGKEYCLPMLRSQSSDNDYRSVADFFPEGDSSICLFAVTAGMVIRKICDKLNEQGNSFDAIMIKLLADRLAEAFAEYINTFYPGCRIAFGYPALPDHTLKREAFEILDVSKLTGMSLTENAMVNPEESVCGLIIENGSYFQIGHIDDAQIKDYARRRGMTVDEIHRHLPNNIK